VGYTYIFGLMIAIISALGCWLVLGVVLKYWYHVLPFDIPNKRSSHTKPIFKGGGIVIAGIVTIVSFGLMAKFEGMQRIFLAFSLCVIVLSALGWLDDLTRVGIRTKLIVESVVGAIILWLIQPGSQIQLITGSIIELTPLIAAPLALFWIVWITNVYNFMDGIDGFAASQAVLSSIVIAGWFLFYGDIGVALLCLALAGAGVGFLFFNWAPARIFLGDAGSLTLGSVFALLAVYGTSVHQIPVNAFLLLYGVFLLDATVTLGRRFLNRERWWEGHASHFYQRAVRSGIGHASVSIGALLLTGCLAFLGTLDILGIGSGLVWFFLGLLLLLMTTILVRIYEKNFEL